MGKVFDVPFPNNEPILSFAPGTKERIEVKKEIEKIRSDIIEIPLIIGGKEVKTGNLGECRLPHEHGKIIGKYHKAGEKEVEMAISSALKASKEWQRMPWYQRVSIFLKAAELLSTKYRYFMDAVVMLVHSKNAFQAEIDIAELIDFWRFNARYAWEIYREQPISSKGVYNRLEYRPLEGFIFAAPPFNFISIGGNLPTAPALMGNVSLWKPASVVVYSNYFIMKILQEAGLPDGVINFIPGNSSLIGKKVFEHPDFAGVHFTGSTKTFQYMWKTIGQNISKYRSYPRIVGETGGKDFVFVHPSADVKAVATALLRGAYEYQGQKCSAASRAYIPESMWNELKEIMAEEVKTMKMGGPEDFTNFITAVIDKPSFDKICSYIQIAKDDVDTEIVYGGKCDDSVGYFIEPTLVLTKNPKHKLMQEEIFGPVLTVYVYPDEKYEETLHLCDETSPYGLTGSIFAQDRYAIELAEDILRHAAGNFYINDKPTGAVVAQQPFGGSRASGTNDKAGSKLNLLRWISVRSIKETFNPPVDYRYPFLKEDK